MHTADRVTLARLPSGVPVETTVHRYGSGDGPTCYVQAAQHGREINGTECCRRLHERLTAGAAANDPLAADLDGTLIVVPVADPLTFDRVSYTTPEPLDSAAPNMNRCWPGDSEGTIHERMAARLWAEASDADAIVDLHTGSPEMQTHTVYLRGDDGSRRLAEAFGTDLLLAEAAGDDADTEWDERNFGGKLRVAATREGIPSITPELGSNKQLDSDAIQTGLDGLLGVFRQLGLLAGDPEPWDGVRAHNHLGRVRAADSGLFVPDADAELGAEAAAGETFGTVYDPATYEPLQTVTADRDGVVYSIAREATVTAGQTLVGIAERLDE
ncbi:succinylglutamate desuccinylase [Halonotius terrestris]|uniref:Succinylglutamate desuccinylase n=1 Tax=Halonotius terrestris TaxID=2487750 RepID=A0A8J8PBW8_9EURY|nr:succinylglutamate desuccinylase/aspartoacylase family protein [Halonotius terrestris]TQQ81192.1 succinylglutamate desuccinylase [Halonotius terrestris]